MQAAWYDRPGPAREVVKIGDVDRRSPSSGEVLVHLKASGINPSDYKSRGTPGAGGERRRTVPHSDGAGIVEQVGDGVADDWIGKAVWLWNAVNRYGYAQPAPDEAGTAAEYVTMPVEFVAPLPDGTSFDVGACLGVPAFTAYAAVYAEGSPSGKAVLVQGGAGSVGELAIQLAAAAGATVVTTVGNEESAKRAEAAGAHHVVNYREQDVARFVHDAFPRGVDHIVEVDFAANVGLDAEVLRPYGSIATYSSTSDPHPTIPYYALQSKGLLVRTIQVFTLPGELRRDAIVTIDAALRSGSLRPTIAARFSLSDIARAHEFAEDRPKGQVVLCDPGGGYL